MVIAAIVINFCWAYWLYFYSQKFKPDHNFLSKLICAMGAANFAAAVITLIVYLQRG